MYYGREINRNDLKNMKSTEILFNFNVPFWG